MSTTDAESATEDFAEFSVIKFFKILEKQIARINTYPITKDNLNIQQDAYRRLAQRRDDEEWDEEDEVFAFLECGRKEADADLRFSFEFAASYIVLAIEGKGMYSFDYYEFADEHDAVRQIIDCMKLLSNGQLAVLITTRMGIDCAKELLLYHKGSRIPVVVATEGDYRWWWKQDDATHYDVVTLRNHWLTEEIPVDKNLFLLVGDDEQKEQRQGQRVAGRSFKTPELTPLTKQLYEHFTTEQGKRLAGKKPGESDWALFYRSWEFWVFLALCGGGLAWLATAHHLPQLFVRYPAITGAILTFLTYLIFLPLLRHKEYLREVHPDHPWVSLDRRIPEVSHKFVTATAPALLFVATFWPVYVLRQTGAIVNWYHLSIPSALVYAMPIALGAVTLLAFVTRRWAAWAYVAGLGLGAIEGVWVNFATTNTDAPTPQPYTFLIISGYLLALVAIWMKFRLARHLGNDTQAVQSVAAASKQLSAKLHLAAIASIVAGYSGAIALVVSALVFRVRLPDQSVIGGHALVIWGGLLAVAVLLLFATVLVHLGKLEHKSFGWICVGITLAVLLALSNLVKDHVDQGPAVAWIPMFVGVGLPMAATSVYDALYKRHLAAELDDQVFQDKK